MAGIWMHLPPDKATPPRPVRLASVDAALEWAAAEIQAGKKRASKDRIDLAALAAHCGTSYAQVETVPDSLFASVREAQANVAVVVVLPPGAGEGTVGGKDVAGQVDAVATLPKRLPLLNSTAGGRAYSGPDDFARQQVCGFATDQCLPLTGRGALL